VRIRGEKLGWRLDSNRPVVADGQQVFISGDNHSRLSCDGAFKKLVVRRITLNGTQTSPGIDHVHIREKFLFDQTFDLRFGELEFGIAQNTQVFFQDGARKHERNRSSAPEWNKLRGDTREK
jgi:hypothetical protein